MINPTISDEQKRYWDAFAEAAALLVEPKKPNRTSLLSVDERKQKNGVARLLEIQKGKIFRSPERQREIDAKFTLNKELVVEFNTAPLDRILNVQIPLRQFRKISTFRSDYLRDTEIPKLNRRFQNAINRFFFGRAAKRFSDRGVKYVCHYHPDPHPHLHILIVMPEKNARSDFKIAQDFIKKYHEKEQWITKNIYCEQPNSIEASIYYNSRKNAIPIT